MVARIRGYLGRLQLGEGLPVRISGVINLSPESFYKGSVATGVADASRCAGIMIDAGADAIDVGAMSTAPYLNGMISEEAEMERLLPAIKAICEDHEAVVTADTQRGSVAEAVLRVGASAINDVSGGSDSKLLGAVAERGASIILLPRPGPPSGKQGPVESTITRLKEAIGAALDAGIKPSNIVIDPGIGFFRDQSMPWYERDVEVLANLRSMIALGRPIYIGVSRKSFIAKLTGAEDPSDRLGGSIAAAVMAVANGASMVRAHDVFETVQAVRVTERLIGRGRAGDVKE